jgi:hypothetical protein
MRWAKSPRDVEMWERVAEECESARLTMRVALEIRSLAAAQKQYRATLAALDKKRSEVIAENAALRSKIRHARETISADVQTTKRQDEILQVVNCDGAMMPVILERLEGRASPSSIYRDVARLQKLNLVVKHGPLLVRAKAKETGA